MMSILVATLVVPALLARDRHARRGLTRMVLFFLAFDAAYVAYVTLVHTALHVPQPWGW